MGLMDKLTRKKAPADVLAADSGFSRNDRLAIVKEFAEADKIEAGLGEAVARYIVTGEGESVMLRIDPILAKGDATAEALRYCLFIPDYPPYGSTVTNEELKDRIDRRHRILIGLDGFDAAGMRRLGMIQAKGVWWLHGIGTDRSPAWLRALVQASEIARVRPSVEDDPPFLDASRIRDMLVDEGLTIAPLVDLLFGASYSRFSEANVAGVPDVLATDPDVVCDEMMHLVVANRGRFMNYLAEVGLLDRVPAFFERIFAAAAANAKATREPALGALSKVDRGRVEARAMSALDSASVEERMAGVHALAAVVGGPMIDRLDAHLAKEKSKKIIQAIEALRPKLALATSATAAAHADGADGYTAIDGSFVRAPPRVDTSDAIPADTSEVLTRLMNEANATSRREYDNPGKLPAYIVDHRGAYAKPFDPRIVTTLIAILEGPSPNRDVWRATAALSGWVEQHFPETRTAYKRGIDSLFARPEFGLKPLARLMVAHDGDGWGHSLSHVMAGWSHYAAPVEAELTRRVRRGGDFREIIDIVEAWDGPAADGVPKLLDRVAWFARDDVDPPNPTVWPVFAAQFDVVEQAITQKSALRRADGDAVMLGLCALFPKAPRRYLPHLLAAAVDGRRVDRRRARAYLETAGDLTVVIAPLLKEASASKRIGAAQWLGERREASAVSVLRAALKVEKALPTKAAIIAALAACGDDISDQFDEERLAAEAKRELPKLKVDYSSFMDKADLPILHWADGRTVDPLVVEYWFARAHKLKQPAGDPLLDMALARLDRDDAAAMGRNILATFIQLDTRKATSDEANAYAEAEADKSTAYRQQWDKDYTRERAFAELRQAKLGEYLGSALDHRGLLALARFAPPGEAVAMVQRYLKDHGKRPNQCRALLELLAADPIPQKLQLILAAAKRHKQPGARKFAGELADAIAEERG